MGPSQLLMAALATVTSASLAPRVPAAPRLISAEFAGNGCPDSTSNTVSGSTSRLSFTFPNFNAELGSDPRTRNRNCIAMLSLEDGVSGYALAVRRISGEAAFYGSPNVTLGLFSTAYWSHDAEFTVSLDLQPQLLHLPLLHSGSEPGVWSDECTF